MRRGAKKRKRRVLNFFFGAWCTDHAWTSKQVQSDLHATERELKQHPPNLTLVPSQWLVTLTAAQRESQRVRRLQIKLSSIPQPS